MTSHHTPMRALRRQKNPPFSFSFKSNHPTLSYCPCHVATLPSRLPPPLVFILTFSQLFPLYFITCLFWRWIIDMWPSFSGKLLEHVLIFQRLPPPPPRAPLIYDGVGFLLFLDETQAQVRVQSEGILDLKIFKLATRFKKTKWRRGPNPESAGASSVGRTQNWLSRRKLKFYHQLSYSPMLLVVKHLCVLAREVRQCYKRAM